MNNLKSKLKKCGADNIKSYKYLFEHSRSEKFGVETNLIRLSELLLWQSFITMTMSGL